jgi:hypothetical protein
MNVVNHQTTGYGCDDAYNRRIRIFSCKIRFQKSLTKILIKGFKLLLFLRFNIFR